VRRLPTRFPVQRLPVGAHDPRRPPRAAIAQARARQPDPGWTENYKQTRPKVERKVSHLMRRKHGGRRARVRGKPNVSADFQLLAAASNLARLAVLGLAGSGGEWAIATG
jgi:hypothetical protein